MEFQKGPERYEAQEASQGASNKGILVPREGFLTLIF